MSSAKVQKPSTNTTPAAATAPSAKRSRAPAETDPNKQPGFAEQEQALSPNGNAGGGGGAWAEPKLGKVSVKSIVISASRKLTAVVDAKISGANNVKGTKTRTYTLTGNDSMNPFECAEVIYDQFQKLDLSDMGLESSHNIEPYGAQRNRFMEEAISAVFDKSRLTDQRDRSAWSAEERQRFDVRP